MNKFKLWNVYYIISVLGILLHGKMLYMMVILSYFCQAICDALKFLIP